MNGMYIGPTGQRVLLLGLLGLIGAIIAMQLPELKRYLKVRAMS